MRRSGADRATRRRANGVPAASVVRGRPEELEELEERYNRLLELAPNGILIEENGRVVRVNAAAVRLAGAGHPDRILGRPIGDFLGSPFLQTIEDVMAGAEKSSPPPFSVPDRFRRVDGREVQVEVTAIPFIEHGRSGAHLVIREVTERLEVDTSQLPQASQLHLLLNQMPAMIWTTDLDLRVTSALGERREALREWLRSQGDIVAAERRALTGESVTAEVECGVSWLQLHVEPLHDAGGTLVGCHGFLLDISDRKRAEGYLHEAQRTEAVGALAGGVAHEVNNMMTVVVGFSEFLLESASLPEIHRPEIAVIKTAAERAANVTRQLLGFSRRDVFQPVAIGLDSLVGDLASIVRQLLGRNRPLALALGCPNPVRVDVGQLKQVIVNLVLNARDAMPKGGTLTLRTSAELVARGLLDPTGTPILPGRYGVIVVRDSGIGMDAETLVHIFDPFFTTKPVGHGTGLGLAAVSGILLRNGGQIAVESSPGLGTSFTLYLPLTAASAVVPPPTEAWLPPTGEPTGYTIMVVDDEPSIRSVTGRGLAGYGFRSREASSGAEALALLEREKPPDLLLTDLTMAEMGGAELARQVEARCPGLPVIFMSGHTKEDIEREGNLPAGASLVHKPFSIRMLASKVSAVLAARPFD